MLGDVVASICRRLARGVGLGAVVVALAAAPAAHADTITTELLPLEPGNSWTYLGNEIDVIDVTVLPELENVGGVFTHVVEFEGGPFSGSLEYLPNDDNGLRTHQLLIIELADPDFPQIGALFTPPILELTPEVSGGQVIESNGNVVLSAPGYPNISGAYANRSTVIGFESVTVEAGTFEALRVDETLTLVSGGQSETSSGSTWYAPGIGEIKEISSDGFLELVSTNVPEPSMVLLQLSALATLAALGFRPSAGRVMLRGRLRSAQR